MSDLEFESIIYQDVKATQVMRNMPRFGHSANFADLFSKVDNDPKDYGVGLLFGGILIISIFVVWGIVLLMLKCMGRQRVGFLSGAPFRGGEENKRPFRVRLVFMLSGIIVIIFGVLLVTHGVTDIRETIVTLDSSNTAVKEIVNDANEIAESLRSIGQTTRAVRDELVSYLGNFCPDEPNVEEVTGFDFDDMAGQAITLLDTLGNFLEDDLATVEDGLQDATDVTSDVTDTVDEIDINDWQALIIMIPLIVLPSILMVGTMLAWNDVSNRIFTCLLNWLVMPLFIIVAILSFVGAGAVMIVAVVNSDWCSGDSDLVEFFSDSTSPDNTISQILINQEIDTTSLEFRAIKFYLTQCNAEDPWGFIREYVGEVSDARAQVAELFDAIDDVSIPRLSVICGRDFGPLDILLQSIRTDLEVLFDSAESVLDLLRCSRIIPIYTQAVYEGTCTYSVTGVTWVWSALLVVAFFSFLMIMFRASWKETDYGDEYDGDMYPTKEVDQGPTFEDEAGNSAEQPYKSQKPGSTPQDNLNDVYSPSTETFGQKAITY